MPTPTLQIPDLPLLQDALTPAPQQATTPVAPSVTIPMPQDNTGLGTVPGTTAHNVATMANQAPSFGGGLPVARASPMQVGNPRQLKLHLCRSVHQQPCHTGHLDTGLPQRKHFFRGYLTMLSPARGLTF